MRLLNLKIAQCRQLIKVTREREITGSVYYESEKPDFPVNICCRPINFTHNLKDLKPMTCQEKRGSLHLCLGTLCNKHLVWWSEPSEPRSRCSIRSTGLYRRKSLCQKGTGAHCYSWAHIWLVGGYFMQLQRSYSSASVYITEPALPVLMWSCA